MLSRTAIEDLERLESAGLHPTPADVVRLNALGLKLEGAKGRNIPSSAFRLSRLAVLAPDLTLREPTVGHEMWLARAEQWMADGESRLALYCFALSRDWTELPEETPAAVKSAVEAELPRFKGYPRAVLRAAVDYALRGTDPVEGEYPILPKEEAPIDPDDCVAAGILDRGRVALYGHSVKDLKSMTRRRLSEVVSEAYTFHNIAVGSEETAERDYFATLDAIEARLKKDSNNGRH